MSAAEARTVADRTARASYGRLVALLAASTGDLALAEDAVDGFRPGADVLAGHRRPRPSRGVAAHRGPQPAPDVWKSAAYRTGASLDDRNVTVDPFAQLDPEAIPDKRLELLVCAHPAINANVRTPLMLQTVLGFEASQIATAYTAKAVAGQSVGARSP